MSARRLIYITLVLSCSLILSAPLLALARSTSFDRFEAKACLLLSAQNEKAALDLSGFHELLYRARSAGSAAEMKDDLINAGKNWQAVTDLVARYNHLLRGLEPPTRRERVIWTERYRTELIVVKISRRQQVALFDADLAGYDQLQQRLEDQEHQQQKLFAKLGLHCS